jgi:hypothetical protein
MFQIMHKALMSNNEHDGQATTQFFLKKLPVDLSGHFQADIVEALQGPSNLSLISTKSMMEAHEHGTSTPERISKLLGEPQEGIRLLGVVDDSPLCDDSGL